MKFLLTQWVKSVDIRVGKESKMKVLILMESGSIEIEGALGASCSLDCGGGHLKSEVDKDGTIQICCACCEESGESDGDGKEEVEVGADSTES